MGMVGDICKLGYDQLNEWNSRLDMFNTCGNLGFESVDENSYLAERCKDLEKGDCEFSHLYGYIVTSTNKEDYLIFAPDTPSATHTYKYFDLIKNSLYFKPAILSNGYQLTVPYSFFGRIYKLTKQESNND